MSENVKFDKQDRIGIITLNRPEAMNAIDDATAEALRNVFSAAIADSTVNVIVFTGEGDKAFAAGSDLRKIHESSMVEILDRDIRKLWTDVEQAPKPTIAAVNGYCIGGGLELALACDIRVASENAKFAISDVNLGFLPGGGAIYRLPKIVGKGKAKEMLLTADYMNADAAYRFGLVSDVSKQEEIMDLALKYASKLARRAPLALRLGKLAVDVGYESGVAVSSHFESIAQALLCTTEDKQEGVTAFFEKRKPEFQGK